MEMQLIETTDDITHVALKGSLDIEGMHAIDTKFHGATAARGKPALIDISGVEFIASLGMGMFIACARSLSRKGARMVLVNPTSMVEEALRAAGIDNGIPIVKAEDEARALLADPS